MDQNTAIQEEEFENAASKNCNHLSRPNYDNPARSYDYVYSHK